MLLEDLGEAAVVHDREVLEEEEVAVVRHGRGDRARARVGQQARVRRRRGGRAELSERLRDALAPDLADGLRPLEELGGLLELAAERLRRLVVPAGAVQNERSQAAAVCVEVSPV